MNHFTVCRLLLTEVTIFKRLKVKVRKIIWQKQGDNLKQQQKKIFFFSTKKKGVASRLPLLYRVSQAM